MAGRIVGFVRSRCSPADLRCIAHMLCAGGELVVEEKTDNTLTLALSGKEEKMDGEKMLLVKLSLFLSVAYMRPPQPGLGCVFPCNFCRSSSSV